MFRLTRLESGVECLGRIDWQQHSLVRVPPFGGLGLFLSKRRKNQLWKSCLPSERFGFVHGKFKNMLVFFQSVTKLREDSGPGQFDPLHKPSARLPASVCD